MLSKRTLTVIVAAVIMFSCSSIGNPNPEENKVDSSDPIQGIVKEIGLYQVDSLQILYFNMDSSIGNAAKRYQRYFTYVNTNDTFLTNQISRHYGAFSVQDSIGDLRSEGKIICLQGNQELKTIYFKYDKYPQHTYFIYNGKFYFFNPDKSFYEKLASLRELAVEPLPENS